MPSAEVVIDGRAFAGWKSVRVSSSLEQVADTFSMSYVDTLGRQPYPIEAGAECSIRLAGNLALTGFVEGVDFSYTADTHDFSCVGRSRACDVVDSSAIWRSGHWRNVTISKIASDLLAPFGLDFVTQNLDALARTPIDRHAIEPGESVAECLGRFARKIGAYITSAPDGTIVIGRATGEAAPSGILTSSNVLRGSRSFDLSQRASEYIAKGQRPGTLTVRGDSARSQQGRATDSRVTRYRPRVVRADGNADALRLTRAAEWARNTAAGQSLRVSYTLKGWTRSDGRLWRPGQIVRVQDPILRLESIDLLLVSTVMGLDIDSGSTTEVQLAPKESLQGTEPPKAPSIRDGVMSW